MTEVTDTELRERLLACGYNAPPITDTSRRILLLKLRSLETGTTFQTQSDADEPDNSQNESIFSSPSENVSNSVRHRISKTSFSPENVAMYSRCYVRKSNFWDRIGVVGTFFVLLSATIVMFFLFKFIGDWSDQRYRSVHLSNGVFPRCSQGGSPGVTCVPDEELKFTESNINVLRAALHHATLTDRCTKTSLRSSDFVGMYPLFKNDYVKQLLMKELNFKDVESDKLLRNCKVLFKANSEYNVKVLNDDLLYRNQRLLRSCGHMSRNNIIYTYALYFLASFASVWFVYKLNRWVNKLRGDNGEERRRLIKDIYDILKQDKKQTGETFINAEEVRKWLNSAINLRQKLWEDVLSYLQEHEEPISFQKKLISGEEHDVLCLKK